MPFMRAGGWLIAVTLICGASMFQGCASVDPASAKASEGAPESAQVEIVSIPHDPAMPTYLVAVDRLAYGASGLTSGGGWTPGAGGPGGQVGPGMSAQLTTALTRVGNVAVVDLDTLVRRPDGTYEARNMQEGEIGPFVIRGTVTEFNETAEAVEKGRGGSLGGVGRFLSFIGGVVGNRTLGNVGTGTTIANPSYENRNAKRSGMVGMDLQLYDGRTGRITRGFAASGTFTSVSATSGASVFGIGGDDKAFASSALGQATRAAMNNAVRETFDALKTTRQ